MDAMRDDAFVPDEGLLCKLHALQDGLRGAGRLAVAFSGGVDSSLLLAVAREVLGDGVLAVIARSPLLPDREYDSAVAFCQGLGVDFLTVDGCSLDDAAFVENPPNRCYLCKRILLSRIIEAAKARGFCLLAEGSNVDDRQDYRPGFQAVLELGVASPLLDAGLTKQDIRGLSRWMGLSTWDKPSLACLASRFPYGEPVTEGKLAMVAAAEGFLLGLGLSNVRVRVHGDLARIEADGSELETVICNRERICLELKRMGYAYVALDLEGYRTGSMNEVLPGR